MTTPIGSVHSSPTPSVAGAAEPTFRELAQKHPDAARAAQEFEAVFLKQLLSSVEKVSQLSGGSQTQSAVVGSMMSGALSDQMSSAGGIGLSEVILRAMVLHETTPSTEGTGAPASPSPLASPASQSPANPR